MSKHTIDMTALTPLPKAVAMQAALEALEAAEADLYPREVQPTSVVRNRIRFAAFVVRAHLKQQESLSASSEVMRWLNEVEVAQGGANGPTIKLRAALLAVGAV